LLDEILRNGLAEDDRRATSPEKPAGMRCLFGTAGQWQVQDSNLRSLQTADLQSDPFGRLGNLPLCSDHM
jgi:hypothetical protein